jgi:hypothetical protein
MSINGLNQGFEVDGNWNTMELTPAGVGFTGDMQHMKVFYGLYGYGATHNIAFNSISVMGTLLESPTHAVPEVPFGVVTAAAAMVVALVSASASANSRRASSQNRTKEKISPISTFFYP